MPVPWGLRVLVLNIELCQDFDLGFDVEFDVVLALFWLCLDGIADKED